MELVSQRHIAMLHLKDTTQMGIITSLVDKNNLQKLGVNLVNLERVHGYAEITVGD
jgi:hypothetical protein